MAGATAASKDVATQEVREAYNSLKQLIATRFKRKAVVEAVEEAPDSASAHEALGGALKEIGADRDSEVRKLAAQLAAALEALGSGVLRRANIKIGDVEGCRDAIVRGLSIRSRLRSATPSSNTLTPGPRSQKGRKTRLLKTEESLPQKKVKGAWQCPSASARNQSRVFAAARRRSRGRPRCDIRCCRRHPEHRQRSGR